MSFLYISFLLRMGKINQCMSFKPWSYFTFKQERLSTSLNRLKHFSHEWFQKDLFFLSLVIQDPRLYQDGTAQVAACCRSS